MTDSTYRAYGFTAYGGPDVQDFLDLPAPPQPGPSDVVVKVHAAGVNPVDWKIREGAYQDPNGNEDFPQVLGVEAAGVVTAVGQDVEGIAVGDRVAGRAAPTFGGTYAEYAVLEGATAVVVPEPVSFVDASATGVSGGTAFAALEQLREAGLAEGDTLLVTAPAGSVGVQVLQIARDRGIAVFGISSESKRPMVESLGAVLIPYDAGTDVVTAARELVDTGYDALLDLHGASLTEYAALVKDPARIITAVADEEAERLGGTAITQNRPRPIFAGVVALMAAGKLDPKVTETYPLDQAAEALASVESGHSLGKIVIDPAQTTQV